MTVQDLLTELLNHDVRKQIEIDVEDGSGEYTFIEVDSARTNTEKLVFRVTTS